MEKFKAYSIILSAFFIPLNPRFSAAFIGLALIFWLLEGNWSSKFKGYSWGAYIGIISFYLFGIVSLLWTENNARAFELLQTRFPLFILPTLFFGWSNRHDFPIKKVLTAFCAGCIVGCVIMPASAIIDYLTTGAQNFFYQDLSAYLNTHPTYFTLYIGFAILIIWSQKILSQTWQSIIATAILLLNVGMLTSRMGIIALVLTCSIGILLYGIQNKKSVQVFVIGALGLAMLGSALYFIPSVNYRFKVLVEEYQETDIKKKNVRAQLWNAANAVFYEQPIIGQGLGDGKNVLLRMTHDKGFVKPYQKKFNAHNQYWQNLIDGGLVGLFCFLLFLIIPMSMAVRRKIILYPLLIILVAINMFTENLIDAQKGTLFIGFFIGLIPLVLTEKKAPVNRGQSNNYLE